MDTKAHSSRADVRQHNLLNAAIELFGDDTPGYFCNCRWQQCDGLCEEVHTNIHGQEGEITFYGQLREESVRYVLRRIQQLNQ